MKPLLWENKDSLILCSLYHGCWWLGDTRSRVASVVIVAWGFRGIFRAQDIKRFITVFPVLCFIEILHPGPMCIHIGSNQLFYETDQVWGAVSYTTLSITQVKIYWTKYFHNVTILLNKWNIISSLFFPVKLRLQLISGSKRCTKYEVG